jgi:type I restriction enzyme, S subunit
VVITTSTPSDVKESEVGLIPKDWDVQPLSKVCDKIIDGTHFTPTYVEEGVPFFSVETITSGDFTNTKFVSLAAHTELSKRCSLRRGDILLTRIGSLGITKLIDWDVEASIYVSLALLRPNTRISGRYLAAYSQSSQFVRDIEARSLLNASPKKINLGDIGRVPVPVPPPIEQEPIADAIFDMDGSIESLDKLIAKKRAIKLGAMQQLLTGRVRLEGFAKDWRAAPLEAVARIIMGQSPSSQFYNSEGAGLPLVQGNADIKNHLTISRVWTTQTTKRCDAGDIVLTVRAPVGAVGLATEPACLGRGVCGLRAKYDGAFLFHALVFAEHRWKLLEQGSTFTAANSAQVAQFQLPIPEEAREQAAIARVLSDMDTEIETLASRRVKMNDVKVGIMQSLLTGRARLKTGKATA